MDMPQIYRPIPRRVFEITPASTPSAPATPLGDENPEYLSDRRGDLSAMAKTRSFLNLTSSTLLGIYSNQPRDQHSREETSTPWGTGAQTPSKRGSIDSPRPEEAPVSWKGQVTRPKLISKPRRSGFRGLYLPLLLQNVLLFGFGVAYGLIITTLHRTQQIATVPLPSVERGSIYYNLSWGIFGIVLGNGLPLLDSFWEDVSTTSESTTEKDRRDRYQPEGRRSDKATGFSTESGIGPIWYSAVRSIGAFVGIAFAVRKIPWQSTLQVSSTLALVNPALWYLIDRSLTGFAFSAAASLAGTFVLLVVNPNFVPVPAIHQAVASEQVGVVTWLASILFCTSLCFGAIGRKLQL